MARLPELSIDTAPPATQKMMEAQQKMFGTILNPTKLMGYCPTIATRLSRRSIFAWTSGLALMQLSAQGRISTLQRSTKPKPTTSRPSPLTFLTSGSGCTRSLRVRLAPRAALAAVANARCLPGHARPKRPGRSSVRAA